MSGFELEPACGRHGDLLEQVHLAGLERCHLCAGFGDDAKGHPVEVGRFVAAKAVRSIAFGIRRVVGELLDRDVAVRNVFDVLERAGADEARLARRRLSVLLGDDDGWRAGRGKALEEGRRRFDHVERHLVVSGDLDVLNRSEQVRGGPYLAIAIKRRLHVPGRHLLAVVKQHALAQREDVGQAVFGDLDAFREDRDRRDVLAKAVERLVDVHVDVARRLRGRGHRVETRWVRSLHGDELAALGLGEGREACE